MEPMFFIMSGITLLTILVMQAVLKFAQHEV